MVNHHGQLWGNYYLCCINPEYRMLQKIKQIRSREYTGQDRRGRYQTAVTYKSPNKGDKLNGYYYLPLVWKAPIATLKGYPFILNGLEFYLQDSHY